MKWVICSIIFLLAASGFAQTKTVYSGLFGDTTRIEMELSTNNGKDYNGRYRFENTKKWILLKGALYYDRRNKNPENLVLYQFSGEQDSAMFDLYFDGKTLAGTWQEERNKPVQAINLIEGPLQVINDWDGIYVYVSDSLHVKSVNDNTVEVRVHIAAQNNCSEIRLEGTLIKLGNQWKGSLPELNGKGDATVIISFEADNVNMEIIPAFLPDAKCLIGKTPFIRQMQREKAN